MSDSAKTEQCGLATAWTDTNVFPGKAVPAWIRARRHEDVFTDCTCSVVSLAMMTGLQWPGGLTAISVIPCNTGTVRQECQTAVHKVSCGHLGCVK